MKRSTAVALAGLAMACAAGVEETAPPAVERLFQAGEVELRLAVPRDRTPITETLRVELEVIAPEGSKLRFPEEIASPEEFLTATTEISPPRLLDDGRVLARRVYELEPLAPGEWTIPPIRVGLGERGDREEIATEAFPVRVDSLLDVAAEDAELSDIRDPVALPAPIWPWLLAAAALAAAVWLWRRRRPTSEAPAALEATQPPHEVALAALQRLTQSSLLAQGRFKAFYGALSDILRRYIEGRFGLRAPERTTEEFMGELRVKRPFQGERQELLGRFLAGCDLVKFAEVTPESAEVEEAVALCRRFIEETKPRPEAVGPVLAEAERRRP